jgi:excinuclease ABC subunit A
VPESHTGFFLRQMLKLSGQPSGAAAAIARATKANGTPARTRSRAKTPA